MLSGGRALGCLPVVGACSPGELVSKWAASQHPGSHCALKELEPDRVGDHDNSASERTRTSQFHGLAQFFSSVAAD